MQPSVNGIEEKIKTEYGIGSNYFSEYIKRWFGTTELTSSMMDSINNDPLRFTWFHFGLSTNLRGRAVSSAIRQYIPKNAKRFLDVGCGYGGFLVAFQELGLEVFGFELDPSLVPLSRANLADFNGVPEHAEVGDVLNTTYLETLGKFDVISCNDVIEHVNDVDLSLKNMANMLNPGGILLIQVPNKDYVDFINNDSHYNLFGITLLRHPEAEEYHRMTFGDKYTVGEYYEYEHYKKQLTSHNCSVTLLPPIYPQKSIRQILYDFLRTIRNFGRFWRKSGQPDTKMKMQVTGKYLAYALEFLVKGFLSIFSASEKEVFHIKYMRDFWFILATKK